MKYYKEILILFGIAFYLMHIPFDNSYQKADIFLFFDYPNGGRYIANILKEMGMYLVGLVFTFLLYFETKKRFYLYILIWWLYNVLSYVLFFDQNASIIGLPLLFILLFINYAKTGENN